MQLNNSIKKKLAVFASALSIAFYPYKPILSQGSFTHQYELSYNHGIGKVRNIWDNLENNHWQLPALESYFGIRYQNTSYLLSLALHQYGSYPIFPLGLSISPKFKINNRSCALNFTISKALGQMKDLPINYDYSQSGRLRAAFSIRIAVYENGKRALNAGLGIDLSRFTGSYLHNVSPGEGLQEHFTSSYIFVSPKIGIQFK